MTILKYSQIILFIVFTFPIFGQNNCFEDLKKQGEEALKQSDFEEAIKSFQSIIRNCDRATENQKNEALALMDKAFKKNKQFLERSLETATFNELIAKKNEKRADSIAKRNKVEAIRANSNKIAFHANQETNEKDKLALAFYAKSMSDEMNIHSTSVKAAFADAVVTNYFDTLSLSNSISNKIVIKDDDFTVFTSGQDLILKKEAQTKTISAHNKLITSLVSYQNGFLTSSFDKTVKCWSREGELNFTMNHEHPVNQVIVDEGSKKILSITKSNSAFLWNEKGVLIKELKGHESKIYEAEFLPRKELILTRSHDKTVRLWDLTGELRVIFSHDSHVFDGLFNANFEQIVTSNAGGEIIFWDLNGNEIKRKKNHETAVFSLIPNSNGAHFLSKSGKEIQLWKGNLKVGEKRVFEHSITYAGFRNHSKTFLICSSDQILEVDLTGKLLSKRNHGSPISFGNISSNGEYFITSSRDGTIKLWNRGDQEVLKMNFLNSEVGEVGFSQKGDSFYVQGRDGNLVSCMIPDYVYKSLKQNPPKLSPEVMEKYEIQ